MLLPGVLRRWICQLGTPIDRWRWDGIRIDIRILENEYGALGVNSELARVKWAGSSMGWSGRLILVLEPRLTFSKGLGSSQIE